MGSYEYAPVIKKSLHGSAEVAGADTYLSLKDWSWPDDVWEQCQD